MKSLINDSARPVAGDSDQEEDTAVVAYYDMAEHRLNCEVCRDEDTQVRLLSSGPLSVASVYFSSDYGEYSRFD